MSKRGPASTSSDGERPSYGASRTGSGTPIPAALAARPADPRRRLPIPYVSEHPAAEGGGPTVVDFTAINAERAAAAGQSRRCSLCADPLGYWIGFLGGPGAAQARVYSDPPGHPECLRAAVELCPYIAIGTARRASDRHRAPDTITPPGFSDTKPDQWVLGLTRSYRMVLTGGTLLFLPAPFTHLQRWRYDRDGRLKPADL
jgi:hypothetical protein